MLTQHRLPVAALLLALPLLPGCLTAGAVHMLTHCDLERLEVHARSLAAPAAEVEWEGACPGNQADDGPRIGPGRTGTLRIPMPDPSCERVEVWADERLAADGWVSLRRTSAAPPAGTCVVGLRYDGRAITAVAAGERVLAAHGVRQVTANPIWWIGAVPDALVMDALVGGLAAVAWPFTHASR
jgi:hypothetical protein